MKNISTLKKYSSNLRVLYVEDDESLRAESTALFELLFDETKVAVDGEDGLNHYRFDGKFDLVITDIYMPKLNGVELVREIRKIDPNQRVIVISAHDDSKYLLELINLGINHFILKPVEASKIMEVLLKVTREIHNEKELASFHEYLKERVDEEFNRRRESETLLIQQAKMAALGEMLGAIAHQWSQPLTVVSMLLHEASVLAKAGNIDHGEVTNCSNGIMKQIDFMRQTVEDFKAFLKPSRHKEHFKVKETTKSVHQIMEKLLKSENIKIEIKGATDAEAYGFANEFKQVILNILSNMKDAIVEHRKSVGDDYAGKITIEFVESAESLLIRLKDNGYGLDNSVVERVFEPYFTTKGIKGTGIGLHIAKTVIERSMNGKISAIASDDGAIFEIVLPRER